MKLPANLPVITDQPKNIIDQPNQPELKNLKNQFQIFVYTISCTVHQIILDPFWTMLLIEKPHLGP